MATRAFAGSWLGRGLHQSKWTGLLNGDDGAAQLNGSLPDKTVHVKGTFGTGGTIIIEGSNDGSTWKTLTDPQGTALSFTAEGMEAVQESPAYMRPRVTAGDGTTDLTCILIERAGRI